MNISSADLSQPQKSRKLPRSGGKGCESLVERSQTAVALLRIPNGVRYLPGGKTLPMKSPVDFVGIVRASGRMLAIDAKECNLKGRFDMSPDKIKPHQREQLIRFGQAGALAGLLVESTAWRQLFWCSWRLLLNNPPSIPWDELPCIGPSTHLINWAKVMEADQPTSRGVVNAMVDSMLAREVTASAALDGQTQSEPIDRINAGVAAQRKGASK